MEAQKELTLKQRPERCPICGGMGCLVRRVSGVPLPFVCVVAKVRMISCGTKYVVGFLLSTTSAVSCREMIC